MRPVALLSLILLAGCGAPHGLDFSPDLIRAIEIEPFSPDGPPSPPVRSNDPAAIREFLAALRSARETTDHKCSSWALVTISQIKTPPIEIALLPGHDPAFFEYRADEAIYRTSRAPMIAALHHLGLTNVPLKPYE